MSGDYYLNYYEVNTQKNQLIHSGKTIKNMDRKFRSAEALLDAQRGLGTEEIQDAVHRLSEQNKQAGELLVQLGEFLKEVISRTEEADLDAKKILEDFSIKKAEGIFHTFVSIAKNFVSVMLTWTGALVTDNVAVSWLIGAVDSLISGADSESAGEAAISITKSLAKFDLNQILKALLGAGTVVRSSVVGWMFDLYEDAVENFSDGEGSFADDLMETGSEAIAGASIYAGAGVITAAIAAAAGLASGGAVVAVVGAVVSIAVKWAADFISEAIYHNEEGFVENTGDVICNWAEQIFG